MTLQISNVRANFSSVYFNRGQDLFKKNQVISLKIVQKSSDYVHIETVVDGSGNNTYIQNIDFCFLGGINNINIEGDCSCPVGYDCKHVVAGVLAYQKQLFLGSKNNKKDRGVLKFSKWLDTFSDVVEQEESNRAEDVWFTFSLFDDYNDKLNYSKPSSNKDELSVIKHAYTAKGNLAKPRRIATNTFFSTTDSFRIANNQSEFTARLLRNCTINYQYNSNITFANEIGFSVLSQLIKLGVIYYKNQQQPLTWLQNTAHSLEINYKKLAKEYVFTVDIPKNHFLVLCEPPIIINAENQQAQMVKAPLSGNSLEKLLEIPKITSIRQLESLMDLMIEENDLKVKNTPENVLPLPVVNEFKVKVINEAPQPILKFYDAELLLFVVCFKYGDLIYSPSREFIAQENIKVDGKRYEIYRKLEIEQDCLKQIEQHLHPIKPPELLEHEVAYSLSEKKLSMEESLAKFAELQIEVFPVLLSQGWILEFKEDDLITINKVDHLEVESEPYNDWFELSFSMTLGKKQISMLPVVRYLLSAYDKTEDLPPKILVPMTGKEVVEFSKKQIAPIFNTFLQLYGRKEIPDTIQVEPFDSHLIHGLSTQEITWKGSKESLQLAKKLKEFTGIEKNTPSKGLKAALREYQQFGLDWLGFLHQFKFNGILADDMGLGKTIQTLAWILKLKETKQLNNPVLLIVPTSLIGNWKAESKRFTPDLTLLTLHGTERFDLFSKITKHDIIITTYPLIVRDVERFKKQRFTYLVLDEAQKIKNPKTKLYQSLQTLKSDNRLCLTGTPIENHLGELWSIFNFLMPGFLSNLPRFKKQYQTPIEKEGQTSVQKNLSNKVSPFLLRRTKKEVVTELPDKTEIIKTAEFEPEQANLYETIRLTMEKKIRDVVAEKGMAKSQIIILDALLKLRQVCCDPQLVKIDAAKKVKTSAKLEMLMDLVTELIEGGNKIILFSQFTSMLSIIEKRFNKAKIKYSLLTGQTKKREEAINSFKDGETSVFLISLKTGGVGLNLTEADTVIHYDPWWNPAVENQATDRAYRIGQNKEVFVYKLIMANTIEEKIIDLQVRKQALQDQVYNKKGQKAQANMTGSDLINLLSDD